MELKCPKIPVGRDAYTFMKRDAKGAHIAVRTSDGGQLVVTVPSQAEYQLMNVICRSEGYEYPSEKWSLLVFSGRYCPGNFTGILAGTDGTGASGSLSGRSPQRRWY